MHRAHLSAADGIAVIRDSCNEGFSRFETVLSVASLISRPLPLSPPPPFRDSTPTALANGGGNLQVQSSRRRETANEGVVRGPRCATQGTRGFLEGDELIIRFDRRNGGLLMRAAFRKLSCARSR